MFSRLVAPVVWLMVFGIPVYEYAKE
jgi:hypothetical protein